MEQVRQKNGALEKPFKKLVNISNSEGVEKLVDEITVV